MEINNVWMLSREYGGIAGAGGVKDVVKGLAQALCALKVETTVVMPAYGFLEPEKLGFEDTGISFDVQMDYAGEERTEGVSFMVRKGRGPRIFLVKAARFSEKRSIYTYTHEDEMADPSRKRGTGHYDYFAMNLLHQKAALGLSLYLDERPQVIHCHDGHTACVPALIREIEGYRQFFSKSGAVVTIHNAGLGYHQEVADLPFAKANTGLPWRVIYGSLLNGAFDPFLAGATYGPVNTVSENYARELQETELDALTGWLGHALKDRGITLAGITNGIDIEQYDPRHPERLGIAEGFDPFKGDFSGKRRCKKRLLSMLSSGEAGVEFMAGRYSHISVYGSLEYRPDLPLLTVVSRLSEQKGIDLIAEMLEKGYMKGRSFNMVILGSGKEEIEERLKGLTHVPGLGGRLCVLLGYDNHLANQIYAGGDFFLLPSRYEPCGLTDFIAQLMGNLPVVRATGGLVKVKDGKTGIVFKELSAAGLARAVKRALAIYSESPDLLRDMRITAARTIEENYTWDKVVVRYMALYEKALGPKHD